MVVGTVNVDYIVFVIDNDEDSIKEKVEEICMIMRLEEKLNRLSHFEEESWDF